MFDNEWYLQNDISSNWKYSQELNSQESEMDFFVNTDRKYDFALKMNGRENWENLMITKKKKKKKILGIEDSAVNIFYNQNGCILDRLFTFKYKMI